MSKGRQILRGFVVVPAIPFPKRRVWNNRTIEATQRLFREFDNVYLYLFEETGRTDEKETH